MAKRRGYVSRRKERVQWRWRIDRRAIGGVVELQLGDYYTCRCWVYRRADGSEFVGLKSPEEIQRDNGQAFVAKTATAGVGYSFKELVRG